jgi:hypothetical protein
MMNLSRLSIMILSTALIGGASIAQAAPAPMPPAPAPSPTIDAPLPSPVAPGDEEDGGYHEWHEASPIDAAPGEPKAGDVLYSASWYGHGLTTIVAGAAFRRQQRKAEEACAAAGGELKNVKVETTGIYYYLLEGTGDCVKK